MPTTKRATKPAAKPAAIVTFTPGYLARNKYGTPSPGIGAECPAGTDYRVLKAELHRLAADVELASIDGRWLVQIEDGWSSAGKVCGRVYLELALGDPRETDHAVDTLQSVLRARGGAA